LLRLLREPVRIDNEEVRPSASVGIAIREEGDKVEDLLRYADAAMYEAKGLGRDQWVCFDQRMREAAIVRLQTETDLGRAVENGQLEVYYQPEFDLRTGAIVGAEALLRWIHPEQGVVPASGFLSIAEETGLIVSLGRWALGQAIMQAAEWLTQGHDMVIRINVSARQLRNALVGEVQEALAAANLPTHRLCLELTETTIMDDVDGSAQVLQQLRKMGVKIAVDDFGTGYSSLPSLKRLPLDILKIDRAIVAGVSVDLDNTDIMRSIVGLAEILGLDVVAEGIENESQLAELVRLGCHRGQGFHTGRPAPANEIDLLLGMAGRLE
jgi:EAL domain-containing protein (putative c-di-GMP-specific phosphodiesterase class I)